MSVRLLDRLRLTTPRDAERDQSFREEIEQHAQIGMRAAGFLGLSVAIVTVVIQHLTMGWSLSWTLDADPGTVTVWVPLLLVLIGVSFFAVSWLGPCVRVGRLVVGVGIVVAAALYPLDFFALGGTHPSRFSYLAVLMLLAVGTMPYRPWHTLLLGLVIFLVTFVESLVVPPLFGNNPVYLLPDFPVSLAIMVFLFTGISALIYRSRYDSYRSHRALRDMQAQLVQTEKMAALGNLVAGVAHEINTPIGSIHANADVIRRAIDIVKGAYATVRVDDPAMQDQLSKAIEILEESNTTMRTATERIVRIVRSLRNFARLDEAERKTVDLHEGIESTLTLVYHEYKNRIEVVRDFGTLPKVECYPNQLNQVFLNILVNAIQAIKGTGAITITTRASGDHVTLSFADTGKGIAPANLDRIFDPGFTTKGVGVGTGLGLSIVYKIIHAHQGRIDVTSTVGTGTTFHITLPVRGAVDATLTTTAEATS